MNKKQTIDKIQSVSKFFRITFQLFLFLMVGIFCISWLYAPNGVETALGPLDFLAFSPIPQSYMNIDHHVRILHALSSKELFLGISFSLIPLGIQLFVVDRLIKIFKLFEERKIFSLAHVNLIKNIGYAILIDQAFSPFYQLVMGAILTLGNPHGHRYMSITLGSTDIGLIITGFVVILISWVMAEGYKLQEEVQLTV